MQIWSVTILACSAVTLIKYLQLTNQQKFINCGWTNLRVIDPSCSDGQKKLFGGIICTKYIKFSKVEEIFKNVER